MDGLCGLVLQVPVGVDHHVERVALDPLLGGELCAQTVDTQHQLKGREEGLRHIIIGKFCLTTVNCICNL